MKEGKCTRYTVDLDTKEEGVNKVYKVFRSIKESRTYEGRTDNLQGTINPKSRVLDPYQAPCSLDSHLIQYPYIGLNEKK